jgi:hypothetical protein
VNLVLRPVKTESDGQRREARRSDGERRLETDWDFSDLEQTLRLHFPAPAYPAITTNELALTFLKLFEGLQERHPELGGSEAMKVRSRC